MVTVHSVVEWCVCVSLRCIQCVHVCYIQCVLHTVCATYSVSYICVLLMHACICIKSKQCFDVFVCVRVWMYSCDAYFISWFCVTFSRV